MDMLVMLWLVARHAHQGCAIWAPATSGGMDSIGNDRRWLRKANLKNYEVAPRCINGSHSLLLQCGMNGGLMKSRLQRRGRCDLNARNSNIDRR